ncbi:hypothetical protein LX99_04541 [Mucilaginibacter oryzae]|uniref:Uncharacterized protein n=1 Tax=Mucilaginibacter oryzae TaxID=468058 RepID=A0A316GZJ8_9SPHI|nr:hypothetical protein LX99_04541 [Mucilaginibacter oryzae]
MKTKKLKNLKIKVIAQYQTNFSGAGQHETDPITVTTIAVTHFGRYK